MIARTRRWVDALVEMTALRLVVWFTLTVSAYPGILKNPYKLANWFDDHALYAFDEADRITVLRYGQLPAWNPYWCGGTAGLAQPEDSFYSPDFLLRLIFGSEHGRRLALLLFFVAGFEGMYRLCRRLDSTAVASALAAVVYGTCDRFVSFIHDGWVHFMSFGLVSWVLLALINGVTSFGWRLVGGFFLAWLILAPGTYPAPYTAVAFGYLVAAISAYRFFRGEPQPFKPPLLSAFTIGIVGILLCTCKLVPTVLYMREFTRQFAVTETHTTAEMLGTFAPRYAEVIVLAIVGLVVGDAAAGICIGGAVLFFLLSLGNSGPHSLFTLMKRVPLLGQLRFPDRFSVMVLFFTAVAASRGLSRLEDAFPRFFVAARDWAERLPLRTFVKRLTRRDLPALDTIMPREVPREVLWIAVGLAAFFSWKIAVPIGEDYVSSQRAPSLGLYVEEAPRNYAQDFKQSRGNRRDSHIFPHVNMGSLNCVSGIPLPESSRLRGDLPQEEYPADPAVATVRRVSWSPNTIVLDVDAKAATTVFVNQNWAPGWRSNVGVVRSDDLLLAVDVPAGQNTVRLDYRSNVLYVSAFISLATLLAILWYAGRELARAGKREWVRLATMPAWPGAPAIDPADEPPSSPAATNPASDSESDPPSASASPAPPVDASADVPAESPESKESKES